QQGQVPGFRSVLGIRVRTDPRWLLWSKRSRRHLWPAADVCEGADKGARPEPITGLRPAVLRSCRDRWDDRTNARQFARLERCGALDQNVGSAKILTAHERHGGPS